MQNIFGKGSAWIIDLVIQHSINILKYNPLAGSTYIKLPKELDHAKKGLINIQNIDGNECFKWSSVGYLNPADRNPARTTKADKDFTKKLDSKDIKFLFKIRVIHKIEKKNFICISVSGYENIEKHPNYVSKTCSEDKNVDL